jgi:outer membrane murein-binding lipoprotein Lpp
MSNKRLLLVTGAIAAALAAGGCVSKGDYEKLQAERDGLDQRVKELESQRAGLEQQKTALERQGGDLRSEVVTLEKQRAQLEAQNQ